MHDTVETIEKKRKERRNQKKKFTLTTTVGIIEDLEDLVIKKKRAGEKTDISKIINEVIEEYLNRN